MAAEELNRAAETPLTASAKSTENIVGKGDMANLIGNVGILIDSTIESVQGMISSVSSATGQLIEGVTSTINSEPVQEIIHNVNSVSGQLIEGVTSTTGQLIEGVTSTINSETVQSSFQELGKLWKSLLENLNDTVSSGQVQNLFNNVSSGLGQLMNNIVIPGMPMGNADRQRKEIKQIPFTQKESLPAGTIAPPVQIEKK